MVPYWLKSAINPERLSLRPADGWRVLLTTLYNNLYDHCVISFDPLLGR